MKKNVGKTYEFKAWVKLVDLSGNPVECNPSDTHPNRGCPSLTLKKTTLDDTKTTYIDSYQHYVATLLPPFQKGEFNLIHGIFFVDDSMASAETVYFSIERFNRNHNIIIDDVSMTPIESSCNDLVRNGKLSNGDALYWSIWQGGNIEMVQGFDGSDDFALKVYGRWHWNHGPAQNIKMGCLEEGTRYIVKTKFRLENPSGQQVNCDPFGWARQTKCPNIQIIATQPEGNNVYVSVATMGAPHSDQAWDSLAGYFYATNQLTRAVKLIAVITGAFPSLSITVDNFEIIPYPQECDNAALNPSFDDGSADFWQTNSVGNSKIDLYSPGAGGSNYAMRSYDRTRSWMGPLQMIDPKCFVSGEEIVFKAKTRLINKDGTGAVCNSSHRVADGKTNCPLIVLQARNCPGNGNFWLWNELDDPYNADEFNLFQSKLTVTDFLSNCEQLWMTFRFVNEAWDILLDDVVVTSKTDVGETRYLRKLS